MSDPVNRGGWPYAAMLPYSLKAYPIVQLASRVGPQYASAWPVPLDRRVADWARQVGEDPAINQIYIHVPFCPFLCHFCPLYKFPATGSRLDDLKVQFVEALKREIHMYRASFAGRKFQSVYFGGGTPTELSPEQLGDILRELRANVHLRDDAEITLEGVARQMLAPEYVARCLALGFNRISFGVQSTDASLRKRIGRGDHLDDYPKLISLVRRLAPHVGINIDLLAGLPEQTFESLQNDLQSARSWAINSVDVLYYVMLPGTRLRTLIQLGERKAPDYGEQIVRARKFVNSTLADAGFMQLTGEVFVRDDRDCFARSSYGGGGSTLNTVLALGPSAFGLVGGSVYQNVCDLRQYVDRVGRGLFPVERVARLSLKSARRRALILSLMMLSIPKILVTDSKTEALVRNWLEMGLLDETADAYDLSKLGRIWYNHMQIDVLPFLEMVGAIRMFGSIQEQDQMFDKPPEERDGFERELINLVSSRRHRRLRLAAYRTVLKLHSLPIFDNRAIGFTGVIESDHRQ